MKGFISFIALIAALSPVMPAYAADIPAKTPPIAESGFEITEVVPPTLPYVSGGNFFGEAHGFNNGLAIVSTDEQHGWVIMSHGGMNDWKDPLHYGVIDTSGNVVLKPEYRTIEIYDEYIRAVPFGDADPIEFHFFDKTGKLLFKSGDSIFAGANSISISDGLIKYYTKDEGDNTIAKFKYLNGKDATSKRFYNYPGDFYKGFAVINHDPVTQKADKKGMMDKSFNVVVPVKFTEIIYGYGKGFDDSGMIPAAEEYGSYGYIDKTGKYIIEPKFLDAEPFCEGLAAVVDKESGLFGFIDKTGDYLIEPKFQYAISFSDGLAAVIDNETKKVGYIDTSGSYVIPPTFENDRYNMVDFSNGLAYIYDYGYIDKTGKVVISEEFLKNNYEHYGNRFINGFSVVETDIGANNEWDGDIFSNDSTFGLIDKTGKLLPLNKYDNVYYTNRRGEPQNIGGYAVVEKDKKVGVIRIKSDNEAAEDYAEETPQEQSKPVSGTGVVTGVSHLNIRSGAGTNFSVIGTLSKGDRVDILDSTGNWYKTEYNGKEGFVYGSYLTVSE